MRKNVTALMLLIPVFWLGIANAAPKELPADVKWETNASYKMVGDPAAKRGGTLYESMPSFPLTFRSVGPDSNGSFAHYVSGNQLSLVHLHPDTDEIVPILCTHWALDPDGKTVYFKLNANAKWSDGKPVTADDFTYAYEFLQSKLIVDPWQNEYLKREFENVQKFTDKDGAEVVAISLIKAKPNLVYYANFSPIPRHFFAPKLNKDFIKATNWETGPVTGPYILKAFDKGKSVTFERVKDWWAQDLPFFKYRFNVDKVMIKVIRDMNAAYKYFEKGEIDMFPAPNPSIWHEKLKGPLYENGYVHRMTASNDIRHSDMGYYLNQDYELLKDINVRLALQHAMNLDKVMKLLLRGEYERLDGVTQGYGKYTNPNIKARSYDIAKAEEYLKKSGWTTRGPDGIFVKDGKRLEVTVLYSSEEIEGKRLVILREEAKKAGFDLKLQLMDSAAQFQAVREKKYQMVYSAWSTSFLPEYSQMYHSENAHKPQTNNITNTDDKEMDRLIDAYRDGAGSEEEKIKLAHQIQQRVHDLAFFIPTYKLPFWRLAYWPWIKFPNPPGHRRSDGVSWWIDLDTSDGGQFWIDDTVKKEVKQAMKSNKKLPVVNVVDKTYQLKK